MSEDVTASVTAEVSSTLAPARDGFEARVLGLREGRPAVMRDPLGVYAELRAHGTYRAPDGRVIVSRYEDARAVYADHERFGKEFPDAVHDQALAEQVPPELADIYRELSAFELLMMSKVDDPSHARLRRIAHRAFTPRMVAQLEEYVQQCTDMTLDAVAERGEFDLVRDFAYRIPLLAIARMLGVPAGDADLIHEWTQRRAAFVGNEMRAASSLKPWHDALGDFRAYVEDLVRTFRDAPPDTNLVTALMKGDDDEQLSKDEVVAMFIVLLFAGHETTTNLIGNGTLALQRQRDQWQRLCASPELVDTAVEELLRYDAPVQATYRVANTEVEIAGVEVQPGDVTLLLIGAANHDESAFPEAARLDVGRAGNRHLSFIVGQRFCLGASLARLEGRIAFTELTKRFPDMELVSDEVTWTPGFVLRGLDGLPVRTMR
jgi:cytochrome P450